MNALSIILTVLLWSSPCLAETKPPPLETTTATALQEATKPPTTKKKSSTAEDTGNIMATIYNGGTPDEAMMKRVARGNPNIYAEVLALKLQMRSFRDYKTPAKAVEDTYKEMSHSLPRGIENQAPPPDWARVPMK